MSLGILVTGFNRPKHIYAVLKSLQLQNVLANTHVWLDGTQGRGEYLSANDKTIAAASRYPVKEIREHRSHIGIEKLMLDALDYMSSAYSSVLVLEDDCFPVNGAVDAFESELDSISGNDRIYSVYGHLFGVEPKDSQDFSRFQGWGWAAHSCQIRRFLPRLRVLFLMGEDAYVKHISSLMTPEIRSRLDRTPGRDVLGVLGSFFSWDSATAFLTAADGLDHRRTNIPVVKNTGITPGIGHFLRDETRLRKPPFNMITLKEAWKFF